MKKMILLFFTVQMLISSQQQPFEIDWIWKKEVNSHLMGLKIDDGKIVYDKLFETKTSGMPEDKWLDPVRLTLKGWVDFSKLYEYREMRRYSDLFKKPAPAALKGFEDWELLNIYIEKVVKDEKEPINSGFYFYLGRNSYSDSGPYYLWAPNLAISDIAEGDTFQWLIRRNGTHDYMEFGVERKTVRRYEYGMLPMNEETWGEAIKWAKKKYAASDNSNL